MSVRQQRRIMCMTDPVAFARIYLSHHLRSEATGGELTFSEAHLDWAERAKKWIAPPVGPRTERDAYIAPRETGKSTWWFLILPMWAAAYGYVKFAAAFADSATQAEAHLQTFKRELDTNEKLRTDFPELCTPARRPRGTQVADNRQMLFAASGFVFAARGIDSGNLGMKVGELRPDLLIMDDVEPGEANYSSHQVVKRLSTIVDVVLPLNMNARVVIVGTVTMPGSIIHQLVQAARPGGEVAQWIADEKIVPHYYPPIIVNDDGTERSLWPGRWPLADLNEMRHTRSFAKNYANDPLGIDGAYWSSEDFTYGDDPEATRWLLSIDPATTTRSSSDYTGLAVVSCRRDGTRAVVHHAEQVRLSGDALRSKVLEILTAYPEIGLILIETNQGGDTWSSVLHTLPVKMRTIHQTVKKEHRAARAHTFYQRGRVLHARRLPRLEEQMVAFPAAPNDDLVDAAGTALIYFLSPKPKTTGPTAKTASYV